MLELMLHSDFLAETWRITSSAAENVGTANKSASANKMVRTGAAAIVVATTVGATACTA
jgi:hypothetical protein